MSDDVEQLIDALRPFVRQCRLSPELDFDEVVEARDVLLLHPFVGLTIRLTRRLQRLGRYWLGSAMAVIRSLSEVSRSCLT